MLDGETMQHEFEDEFESEYEYEDEYEGEEFLGDVLKGVGGALGLFEGEGEYEYEYEDESEAFFKKLRGLAKKVAPILKKVAPIAARAVGTAIGGPGVGQALGSIAGQLGEFEDEYEFEGEFEDEYEAMPQPEALAEALAAIASQVQSEAEAEAYTGAFTARIIPVRSASMARISPKVVKGAATLTRTLRKHPATRPLVKTVPTIVARTGQKLAKQAAQGRPVTPTTAAKVMAGETKKVLGNPMTCAKAMVRSTEAAKKVAKAAPAKQSEYEYEDEYEGEWAIDPAPPGVSQDDWNKLDRKTQDRTRRGLDERAANDARQARKKAAAAAAAAAAKRSPKGKKKREGELYEFYY